jgi:hypothetical protein
MRLHRNACRREPQERLPQRKKLRTTEKTIFKLSVALFFKTLWFSAAGVPV